MKLDKTNEEYLKNPELKDKLTQIIERKNLVEIIHSTIGNGEQLIKLIKDYQTAESNQDFYPNMTNEVIEKSPLKNKMLQRLNQLNHDMLRLDQLIANEYRMLTDLKDTLEFIYIYNKPSIINRAKQLTFLIYNIEMYLKFLRSLNQTYESGLITLEEKLLLQINKK